MGGWEDLYGRSLGDCVACVGPLAPPQSHRRETEGGTAGSLPDIFRFALRLAPTRAHPPPAQPRATTYRLAQPPLVCPPSRRLMVGWVPRNVVARGGWVDVGGPCGCQVPRDDGAPACRSRNCRERGRRATIKKGPPLPMLMGFS